MYICEDGLTQNLHVLIAFAAFDGRFADAIEHRAFGILVGIKLTKFARLLGVSIDEMLWNK